VDREEHLAVEVTHAADQQETVVIDLVGGVDERLVAPGAIRLACSLSLVSSSPSRLSLSLKPDCSAVDGPCRAELEGLGLEQAKALERRELIVAQLLLEELQVRRDGAVALLGREERGHLAGGRLDLGVDLGRDAIATPPTTRAGRRNGRGQG
jgi:hypothetical protein